MLPPARVEQQLRVGVPAVRPGPANTRNEQLHRVPEWWLVQAQGFTQAAPTTQITQETTNQHQDHQQQEAGSSTVRAEIDLTFANVR